MVETVIDSIGRLEETAIDSTVLCEDNFTIAHSPTTVSGKPQNPQFFLYILWMLMWTFVINKNMSLKKS